ncbi:cell wall-associated NlpC family hydrolase [Kribbella sp. VKM Ac-2527]|uniref:Cell wall-associated NlpC family hydrolase n=1 Tax=Kribbella caucasensis TaxID=2512215 RepID=A0A4R6J3B9_9ACTN|nr:C40 family peptidase [Kribbella sp. VKM Ac-2527]TDO29830.1 cell wall-associated NlpC family hydrolase [Kribbella sp. VKM Ac-2527]
MSIGRINRTRGIALAAITSTAVVASVLFVQNSADADPKPTLEQAKAQVAELQHKAEAAGEAANDLRGQIKASSDRVKSLQAGIKTQQVQVDGVKRQIGSLAVAGYQTSGMTTTAQLLLSTNPDQFLSQASTAQAFAGQQNSALRRFQTAQGKLTDLQASEQSELAALQEVQAKQNELKKQIQTNLDAAEKVLSKLSDAERARIQAENDREEDAARKSRPTREGDRLDDLNIPVSGRAGAAINYAMAQLGDPYVWGADGPSSFDCSGLTMAAWARAGVSLSHSSKAQASEGRRVSKSMLKPGDLVFYYSPISHVAMYIGNGRIVHASRPGKPVKIDDVDLMPYNTAVRPG